jgi:DNA-binding NarL/FixJ family response regulator
MMHEMRASGVVLVVDDSPDTLSFLTDALDAAGMTVLIAVGGENALALLNEAMPDVVLLDAVMPGLDGFATCRRMKADPRLSHLPVIFMTGLTETEHVIEGLEAGGVDYVTKPIIADELIARIRVHRDNARIARSSRLALDAAGRVLMAASAAGEVLWTTPQAATLWASAFPGVSDASARPLISGWLKAIQSGPRSALKLPVARGGSLELSLIATIGTDEFLLTVGEANETDLKTVLQRRYALTPREAEVLVWVARGKPNRDVAEILALSPRTVNKHLEQIYAKLGVENRTAAAACALNALAGG